MSTRSTDVDSSEELLAEFGDNASYVADLLNRYRANPASVDDEWRRFFRDRFGEPEPPAAPTRPAEATAAPPIAGERVAIRGAALRIAQNMEASLEVPTATSQRQIPIRLLDENRRLINEARARAGEGKVSFTHLVSWAVLRALEAFPRLNDAFDDSGGEPARVGRSEIRFGLAVDVTKSDGSRSLLVPNIRSAEKMGFAEFLAAAEDVTSRGRPCR
jgi:2-oxoglutarate decarboxylase